MIPWNGATKMVIRAMKYFRIVYRMAFRRSNFYPDYIIQLKNGDVWIIETKGGMTADGSSNNIDKYAFCNFDALKEGDSRHSEIKWGFVRVEGTQIYLSNTEWSEMVLTVMRGSR